MRSIFPWSPASRRSHGRALVGVGVLFLLSGGCAPGTTAISVGPRMPPRPKGCAIREERLTPKDAEDRYRQVGVVCWSGGDREDLDEKACELGGDIVVRSRRCMTGEGKFTQPGIEYGVYASSR
jgi:hypothetical protein